MEMIVRPRQAGKTYKAVKWVMAGDKTTSYPGWSRVLLCHDLASANHVREVYPTLDYHQVFSFEEWQNARLGPRQVEVAVDNADLVLQRLLRQPVSLATVTGVVQP